MDHQQYKLLATINFIAYPIENGKMLPGYKFAEKHIAAFQGSLEECKKEIENFNKKNTEFVKMRG